MVPDSIASRCEWRFPPDLGSDHLSIYITIPIPPMIESLSSPPFFSYGKAHQTVFQLHFDFNCFPFSSFKSLSLSHPEANASFTKLLDAATFVILYGSANQLTKAR